MDVRPQSREEEQGGYSPPTNWASTIDGLYRQLSNAKLGDRGPAKKVKPDIGYGWDQPSTDAPDTARYKTPDQVYRDLQNQPTRQATIPEWLTGLGRVAGDALAGAGVVLNPGSRLAKYAAAKFPKITKHLADSPVEHEFVEGTRRWGATEGNENLYRMGAGGLQRPLEGGKKSQIIVRQDVADSIMGSPQRLEQLRQAQPSEYRQDVSTLPHEMNHAIRSRLFESAAAGAPPGDPLLAKFEEFYKRRGGHTRNIDTQGMPFPSTKVPTNIQEEWYPTAPRERQWEKNVIGEGPRSIPDHILEYYLSMIRRGISPAHANRETLTQRAAENAAKQAGLLTEAEYAGLQKVLKGRGKPQE